LSDSLQPAIPEYWQPARATSGLGNDFQSCALSPRRRILIAKPGLDGHDRGAKYVAQVLRDAGFDVFYTGIRRTPRQIVAASIFHEVDAIGLSLLSGAHNFLFAETLRELQLQNARHICLLGGGVIPPEDVEHLMLLGVKALFTPGTPAAEIVAGFRRVLNVAAPV
jgi:methylmalonyl-CoA mutase C-terminal domain/subunit